MQGDLQRHRVRGDLAHADFLPVGEVAGVGHERLDDEHPAGEQRIRDCLDAARLPLAGPQRVERVPDAEHRRVTARRLEVGEVGLDRPDGVSARASTEFGEHHVGDVDAVDWDAACGEVALRRLDRPHSAAFVGQPAQL
jgi:hypothetical protein